MSKKTENIWVPLADLMTALMLIFLLIVVLILNLIPPLDSITKSELEKFELIFDDLYQELNNAFLERQDEWGIRISKDLTIAFENTNILFDQDSSIIKEEFKLILDEFIPLYLSIVTKEKYKDKVKEIKIEGHTADASLVHNTYIRTVELSQNRSRSILEYILLSGYASNLSTTKKEELIFLLNANGYGYGRAIDSSRKYVYESSNPISPLSRRVEFKITTNSEELVETLKNKFDIIEK